MKQFAAIIQAISLLLMKTNKKMFEYTVLRNRQILNMSLQSNARSLNRPMASSAVKSNLPFIRLQVFTMC